MEIVGFGSKSPSIITHYFDRSNFFIYVADKFDSNLELFVLDTTDCRIKVVFIYATSTRSTDIDNYNQIISRLKQIDTPHTLLVVTFGYISTLQDLKIPISSIIDIKEIKKKKISYMQNFKEIQKKIDNYLFSLHDFSLY